MTLAPPPVDLAAEDDHVRHHVEPEQQDRRAAEGPQRHVDVGEADEDRQPLERRLEHDRAGDRARQRFPPFDACVRQPAVDREQEREDAGERRADRDDVGEDGAVGERPEVVLQDAHAEPADDQAGEQRHEHARRERRGQQLPAQKAPVREAVNDVECRLQRAEERERRPEEPDASDDPERRGVVLHAPHELDDAVERCPRKGVLQFLDEEVRRLGAMGEAEEREREKDERHEREKREVRDHRCEVRATVGEELVRELASSNGHGREVCTLIPSESWMRGERSRISSRSRLRSRRRPSWRQTALSSARWASPKGTRMRSRALHGSSSNAPPRSAVTAP